MILRHIFRSLAWVAGVEREGGFQSRRCAKAAGNFSLARALVYTNSLPLSFWMPATHAFVLQSTNISLYAHNHVKFKDLVTVYVALMRSVLEYYCVVWYHALPVYLSEKVERIQKHAFKIIAPALSNREALLFLNLPRSDERCSELLVSTFKKISKGLLSKHLPKTRVYMQYHYMRNAENCAIPKWRTERLLHSFFPIAILTLNNH